MTAIDPAAARAQLGAARLMLVLTPHEGSGRDPLEVVAALVGLVDVVQVRPKPRGDAASGARLVAMEARATADLARAVLARLRHLERAPLVVVDDRVDVALALRAEGVAGVHLGAEDLPPELARAQLGPEPLIGLSTHSVEDVVRAAERGIDYLGFGPIHATATKGYERGLSSELAWVANAGASVPLFPIGGIDATNIAELAAVGRAAVGAALLDAVDPAAEARRLLALLAGGAG